MAKKKKKKKIVGQKKRRKKRKEVDDDLDKEFIGNDSLPARVEVLLIQILRELQIMNKKGGGNANKPSRT